MLGIFSQNRKTSKIIFKVSKNWRGGNNVSLIIDLIVYIENPRKKEK
jgi:hypothetical protein